RIIHRIEQTAQSAPGGRLQLVVAPVQTRHGLVEFVSQAAHLPVEAFHSVLFDQANAWLRVWKGDRPPVGSDRAANRRDLLVGRMAGVEQFLAGSEEVAFRSERLCSLG